MSRPVLAATVLANTGLAITGLAITGLAITGLAATGLATTGGSASCVTTSGSGASHGLRWAGRPRAADAARIALTSTDRSVVMFGSSTEPPWPSAASPPAPAAPTAVPGSGRPSPCHGTGITWADPPAGPVPGRRPPILADCTCTGLAAPERT